MNLDAQRKDSIKVGKEGLFFRFIRQLQPKEKTNPSTEEQDENQELIQSIKNAKMEWMSSSANFDYISDNEIIDYYVYKIKACEARYEYLIRKAKEKGIRAELIDV